MHNLVVPSARQRKYAEAEQILQYTVTLQKKVLGKEHLETLLSMQCIAYVLKNQKRYAEAEQILQEMLALQKEGAWREAPRNAKQYVPTSYLTRRSREIR
jgi:hypothetical protein